MSPRLRVQLINRHLPNHPLSNLDFFSVFRAFFWLIRLFLTCVLQLSLGHQPYFILSVRAGMIFSSSFVSNFVCLLMLNWQWRCIKLYLQKFSYSHVRIFLHTCYIYYFPTCCKELYQEAKFSRWAHTRSSRRHIQQGSISACSRSTSERKGKEGTRGKYLY